MILAGVALGLIGSLFLTEFLSVLLFCITADDPATFVAVALALIAVGSLASYAPARRATRLDPMKVLRIE